MVGRTRSSKAAVRVSTRRSAVLPSTSSTAPTTSAASKANVKPKAKVVKTKKMARKTSPKLKDSPRVTSENEAVPPHSSSVSETLASSVEATNNVKPVVSAPNMTPLQWQMQWQIQMQLQMQQQMQAIQEQQKTPSNGKSMIVPRVTIPAGGASGGVLTPSNTFASRGVNRDGKGNVGGNNDSLVAPQMQFPFPFNMPMPLSKDNLIVPNRKSVPKSKTKRNEKTEAEMMNEMTQPMWTTPGMPIHMIPDKSKLAALPGLVGTAAMNAAAAMPRLAPSSSTRRNVEEKPKTAPRKGRPRTRIDPSDRVRPEPAKIAPAQFGLIYNFPIMSPSGMSDMDPVTRSSKRLRKIVAAGKGDE